ncbi:MAG TPA: hypothetical protein VFS40_01875 [Gemmatimonadales bacterium]|nr:hypothetical protein [Gemmatimonadales bacterium]
MSFSFSSRPAAGLDELRAQWQRYHAYLAEHAGRFPPGARALVTEGWYHDPSDPRCPHEARLVALAIAEESAGAGAGAAPGTVTVTLRLLGVDEDRILELRYREVSRYRLELTAGNDGHREWLYDELRVTDAGRVVHEIEWAGAAATASWRLEAADVEFTWTPAA